MYVCREDNLLSDKLTNLCISSLRVSLLFIFKKLFAYFREGGTKTFMLEMMWKVSLSFQISLFVINTEQRIFLIYHSLG